MPCSDKCNPHACPYHPWGQALDGLPPDVAATAMGKLRQLNAPIGTYRLPLLTSVPFAGFTSSADLVVRFPAIGVIFGVSQRVITVAPDDVVDMQLTIIDSSSQRTLIGTTVTSFNLAAVPDAQKSGMDQLRVSPMLCDNSTQWQVQLAVVAGNLATPARGAINLLGISFWEQGSQLTSRLAGPQPEHRMLTY